VISDIKVKILFFIFGDEGPFFSTMLSCDEPHNKFHSLEVELSAAPVTTLGVPAMKKKKTFG
jgi:hypothetical protein